MADQDITKKILLELNINASKSKDELDETNKSIEQFKESNDKLLSTLKALEKQDLKNSEQYKKTRREYDENNRIIKVQTELSKSLEKQLTNLEKANLSETGSLTQKRAALNAANAEYARTSQAMKETDATTIALGNSIAKATEELKAQESSLGDNRRNVGNYKQAILEASNAAQALARSTTATAEELAAAKKKVADLTEEFNNFKKSTQSFDQGDNLQNFGGTVGNISNNITQATSSLNVFGSSTDAVTQGINGVSDAFQGIAAAPNIIKEAKIAMQGFAATTGIALGPLLAIGAGLAAIAIAVKVFNNSVDEQYDNLEKLNKKAEELKKNNEDDFIAGFENIKAGYKLTTDAAQAEIDRLKSIGADKALIHQKELALVDLQVQQLHNLVAETKKQGELSIQQKNDIAAKEQEFRIQRQQLITEYNTQERNEQIQLDKDLAESNTTRYKAQIEILKDFHARKHALTELANLDDIKPRQDFLNTFIQDNENRLSLVAQYSNEEVALKSANIEAQRGIELENAEKTGADKLAINEKYNNLQRQLDIQTADGRLSIVSGSIGKISTIFKQGSAAYKALAVTQTYIDTFRAATAALAPPPTGAGPLFGPILAGATVIAGTANAAKILATKDGFYDGGFTGSGNPRETSTALGIKPYIYHKEEYVTPHQVVGDPRATPHIAALEYLRTGKSMPGMYGYASGGFAPGNYVTGSTGQSIQQQYSLEQGFINAVRSMPNPIVTVQDINLGQQNVSVTESRAIS